MSSESYNMIGTLVKVIKSASYFPLPHFFPPHFLPILLTHYMYSSLLPFLHPSPLHPHFFTSYPLIPSLPHSLPHSSTQNFRTQITTKQPDVDTMLALGRAIVAEPNTNPQNDTVMQKLTGFIEDWSDLQLAWQNWYDELHANLEQSKNLSDQLSAFGHSIKGLEAPWTNLFPATVTMENLDTELQELQVRELISNI